MDAPSLPPTNPPPPLPLLRLYCSWDMACDGCSCYFHFGLYFSLLPPWQPKKSKFQKNVKNTWRYHFTHMYQKLWLDGVQFLRYGAQRTDRQTDGRKKWNKEVGAPPKSSKHRDLSSTTVSNISSNILSDHSGKIISRDGATKNVSGLAVYRPRFFLPLKSLIF